MKKLFMDTIKESQDMNMKSQDLTLSTKQEVMIKIGNAETQIEYLKNLAIRVEKLQEVCKETFLKFDVKFDGVVKDNQQALAKINKRFDLYEVKS